MNKTNLINEEKKFIHRRLEMVEHQIIGRGIIDHQVITAMRQVPRQVFVSEALMDSAYGDHALPIGENQTISQPYIIALMTQALALTGNERILEVGTGSGYQAAVLSKIAYRVYTIERNHNLYIKTRKLFDLLKYHNIATKYSDGTNGWKDESPFDCIIVTAGGNQIPSPLVDQLAMEGSLVMPVGSQEVQDLIRVEKTRTGIKTINMGECRFVKLIGQHGWNQ